MKLTRLNALLAFVTVAEKRGFSAAARTLGVSASALSQSVRALEDRVGVPLLVRTTRGVNVTEAGQRLLERSAGGLREALDAIDEAASSGSVLDKYMPSAPGFFLHCPARAQNIPKMRALIETVRSLGLTRSRHTTKRA